MMRRSPQRERGTVYLLVLSVTAMLVAIGVTSVLVGRIDVEADRLETHQTEARLIAQSAIDLVRHTLDNDADWRTTYANDDWTPNIAVGGARYRYKLVDEADGDLADDPTDPVRLYVLAIDNEAVRVYSVVLRVGKDGEGEFTVVRSSDDGGQTAATGISATNVDYALIGRDGLITALAGVRFDNLPLPPGTTINTAAIQFTSMNARSDATAITIRAEAEDDAATFAALPYNFSNRSKTAAQVAWSPGAWATGDHRTEQLTPDLSDLVQEVIDRPGWQKDNAVAFILEGTKARNFRTFDHSAATAPVLHLTYTAPGLVADYTTFRQELYE